MTTQSIITLTPKAITKVEDILSKEKSDTAMLRVVAMPSPGGSIQYMFAIEDNPAENDKIFEFENVKVLIDENSIDMIQGSEIDYIDSIMRSGSKILNLEKSCLAVFHSRVLIRFRLRTVVEKSSVGYRATF